MTLQETKRQELHEILVGCLGSRRVYFQPPDTLKMSYPCIIYSKIDQEPFHGNNRKYILNQKYSVTAVDTDPDSIIPDKVTMLPLCEYERYYCADNLHHHNFTITY